MAIPRQIRDREYEKFKESTTAAGQVGVVVVNPDGSDIAGGSGGGDGAILDGVSSAIKATVLDYTASNPLAVRLSDTDGNYVGAGAGTQYADGAAKGSATGTLAMGDDGTNIQSVHVDSSGDLQVDVLSSALPTGAATSANQTTMIGHLDGVEGLLATIDSDTGTLAGAVAGTEMQVDVLTMPTTTVTGTVTANLGTIADVATQTTLSAINTKLVTGTDIGDVTINNSTGAAAVNIQDGGNSITVDGTFWQATQPVSGTFWQATQPVSGTFWQATQPVSIAATVTVSATNLDVRDLTSASDSVEVKQATGTNLHAVLDAGTAVVGKARLVTATGDEITDDTNDAIQTMDLSQLVPKKYDYIALSYTGDNLTGVVYKSGGSGGSTQATLTLAYTGSQLDTVTRS